MRRFLATLALVAVSATGPMRLWCELRCADELNAGDAVLSHCHEDSSNSAPAVSSTEACGDHDAAPAITRSAIIGDRSVTGFQALPVEFFGGGLTRAAERHSVRLSVDTSPPDRTKNLILRV